MIIQGGLLLHFNTFFIEYTSRWEQLINLCIYEWKKHVLIKVEQRRLVNSTALVKVLVW